MMELDKSKGVVIVNFKCVSCGKDVPVTVYKKDYEEYCDPELPRRPIQRIFPYLNRADREMFMSGICDECFEKIFPEEMKE